MTTDVTANILATAYQRHLDHYQRADPAADWLHNQSTEFLQQLELVWSCSDFVAEQAAIDPGLFRQLVKSGDLCRSYQPEQYGLLLAGFLEQPQGSGCAEEHLHKQLRRFRRREMMRIIWRDFTRQASLEETTSNATSLAEACINLALAQLHKEQVCALGSPVDSAGAEQQMLVIAMGKMGACELNISSDIDLIFAYPEAGATIGGSRSVSNQEFFTRLGQRLIAALDRQTADGFVFRVDMRLRPYGQSGSLVMNFSALEEYYLAQGRDWERYAMIKARVVAGDQQQAQVLEAMLHPFIYRKYLDYGAIESLRDLKRAIVREVSRKGLADNIKLGSGGIREVEFIAQTFQLIRGGKSPQLQTQSLHQALRALQTEQLMSEQERTSLWRAYEFLRNTEHALQGMGDKQTQQLPQDQLGQLRVAVLMGCDNWVDFNQQLQHHRQQVSDSFAAIITEQSPSAEAESGSSQTLEWLQNPNVASLLPYLQQLGYEQPQPLAEKLANFYASRAVQLLQVLPRSRLDALMPKLLKVCANRDNNSYTLGIVLGLVQEILRRSAYLALLVENAQALEQLCLLCERSRWIAEQLTNYPALLDELLDPRTLYTAPEKQYLRDQLRQQTVRVASEDMEQQMDVIRYFCRSYSLRVAACELMGVMPLMQVSDYLTWIAEVAVEHVTNVAWDQLQATYGSPPANGSQYDATPGFVVVAYGKMGGLEMGYKSDLDLVFLHNAKPNQVTDGQRSIDVGTFFMRLGQRIIHLLSTPTAAGIAYETDMRLRPSGNSGMLVSRLSAFEKYQRQDAWTWEHQALMRARVVAGDTDLAEAFDQVRERTLRQKRNRQSLANEVREMREKMRIHLGGRPKDGKFSLKQGSGGIVDIEFMVQFAVLAWSGEHPELACWSDTIRTLESLADVGLITAQQSQQLIEAYKAYRSAGHRLQLQNQLAEVADSEFLPHRAMVQEQWQQLFS